MHHRHCRCQSRRTLTVHPTNHRVPQKRPCSVNTISLDYHDLTNRQHGPKGGESFDFEGNRIIILYQL